MNTPSLLDTIGNTPLVKLQNLNPNPKVEIWVKLEFFNPSGSIKDRIVKHIIEDAENTGLLKPGGTIVENTSGNTGAAVAIISAVKKYKAILVMPDKVSQEKQNAIKAYGAKIIITPTSAGPDSPENYANVARRITKETPGSFHLNQHNNSKNPEAHYLTTGPEIWRQTNGKVTHFIAAGGTGGTISGTGKFLKEKNPALKIIMPDPVGSMFYEYFKTGKINENANCAYQVEGVGEDFLPKTIDFSVIDDVTQFSDANAFLTARNLAVQEGILSGGSGGANIWAALQLAQSLDTPAVIVTVIPDGGVKYLSKFYNNEWLEKNITNKN